MSLDDNNPYAPPAAASSTDSAEAARDACPVCRNPIANPGRYVLPFGYCVNCKNFLTVRNWAASRVLSLLSFVVLMGFVYELSIGRLGLSRQVLWQALAVWFVARVLYDRATGRLVPATCWGLFAFADDDRLPTSRDAPIKG